LKPKSLYNFFYSGISILLIYVFTTSCRSTKLVPEEKYLLTKSKVICNNSKVKKDELSTYIKQKPNRKIFFVLRFHLGIYNISHAGKEKKWKKWLGIYKMGDIIGEPPVIYDSFMKDKSKSQLLLYLRNKGYYHATVADTVIYKKKRASVIYSVNAFQPYTIRNITYNISDPKILNFVLSDSSNSKIKHKSLFDVDVLQEERSRITDLLKNNGLYYFSKEYIFYQVDSSLSSNQVDISLGIKNLNDGNSLSDYHKQYKIKNIFINLDYDPKNIINDSLKNLAVIDTLEYNGLYLLYNKNLKVKPELIFQNNYIKKGDLYRLDNLNSTYKQLSSLKIYKFINISFEEISGQNLTNSDNLLNCYIYLTPLLKQSYQVEFEGTISSGNYGTALNYIYQHKNLLKGAELFDLKFKGAVEQQTSILNAKTGKNTPFNTIEIGGESKINVPKLLIPFKFDRFIKKYNPHSEISISYDFQQRPDFTRTITNLSFSYLWNTSQYVKNTFNLFQVNYVKVPVISNKFEQAILNTYLENSYKNHLVPVISYNITFNNQNINRFRNFILCGVNLESAGNIVYGINNVFNEPKTDGSYEIFNTKYAQFLKTDIDFRYYFRLNSTDKLVFRAFAGAGYPYGNLNVMPFEQRYFSGGANSVRAWAVRSIGPGTFKDTISFYPNQTGDIKIEANVEYRFKLLWKFEGAYFIDTGNIWAINKNDDRQGALFDFTSFYRELAVGSGLGLRIDLSFFIFRFDFGVKILDPQNSNGDVWVLTYKKFTKRSYALNVGIGYPF
jgi:hypothetical protein